MWRPSGVQPGDWLFRLDPAPGNGPPHPDVKQSLSSSGEELISEVLDRIISSSSHACLSGKITQPPTCTHTLHSHCSLISQQKAPE